jgi:hypothetical protein
MKTKKLRSITIILFLLPLCLVLLGAGCDKDEDFLELQIGDENPVIIKEVDGIEFKFCLLNEQGQPANVFNEGENITFQFNIKNNREESLPFFDYGFLKRKDFFAANSKNKYYGKPYLYDLTADPNLDTYELRWIPPDSISSFTDIWLNDIDDRLEMKDKSMFPLNSPLEKGHYYTRFSYNFTFGLPDKDPVYESGELTFKINFEIK